MNKHKIITLILFLVSISTIGVAQTSKKVNISNSIEMTNNIDEVWTIISNLENLDNLVPEIIEKAEMVGNGKGSVITLTLKSNGKKVVEEVTKLNNKKHIIVYEMLETPMPMVDYKATIRIIPLNSTNYNIHFDAVFKVNEKDKETMETIIDNFQKTFLLNIKKKHSYEK